MIVLNGFNEPNIPVESYYKSIFEGHDWIDLRDYSIGSCRSCGSCATRTPGQCIKMDDFDKVAKKVAKADGLVYLTPVTFGGYSSTLKYFIDRSMCMGLPLYKTYKGKLLHPMRYQWKTLIEIGVDLKNQNCHDVFRLHIEANALNMQLNYQIHIVTPETLEEHEISFDRFKAYQEVI